MSVCPLVQSTGPVEGISQLDQFKSVTHELDQLETSESVNWTSYRPVTGQLDQLGSSGQVN